MRHTMLKSFALTTTAIVALSSPAFAQTFAPHSLDMGTQPTRNWQQTRQAPTPQLRLTSAPIYKGQYHAPAYNAHQNQPVQYVQPAGTRSSDFRPPMQFAPHNLDTVNANRPRFNPRTVFGRKSTQLAPVQNIVRANGAAHAPQVWPGQSSRAAAQHGYAYGQPTQTTHSHDGLSAHDMTDGHEHSNVQQHHYGYAEPEVREIVTHTPAPRPIVMQPVTAPAPTIIKHEVVEYTVQPETTAQILRTEPAAIQMTDDDIARGLASGEYQIGKVETRTRTIVTEVPAPIVMQPVAQSVFVEPTPEFIPIPPMVTPELNFAQPDFCEVHETHHDGAVQHMREARNFQMDANTEGDILRPRSSASKFKISVDGHTVAGDGFEYEAEQRHQDVALSETNIQIKYDGLDVEPMLNAGLVGDAVAAQRGELVDILTYANYNAFIQSAEIRVFDASQGPEDVPIVVLPVVNGHAQLQTSGYLPDDLFYMLRVYDNNGQFDETNPKPLHLTDDKLPDTGFDKTSGAPGLSFYGNDSTYRRNIKVSGGAVTVYGFDVPLHHEPVVMDRFVPIDADGTFVTQEILPYGDQSVTVNVHNEFGEGVNFKRDIHIKDKEFFYVAIGDLTLGQRGAIGPSDLTAAEDEDFDDVVVNGRGAFYLKGKVRGDYLITAAMDTGEENIENIFSNLDQKDPRQLLRRLDSDQYYPVYGDDSYIREDAPTQGKFYVRLDRGDDHIMWGNFATQVTGTEFAHLDRGLYGGLVDFNSDKATSFGERKTEITAFAADPGTIPGRDEFRGTGGSIYFLQRQDLTIGAERLRVEIRDKVTGDVIETRNLRPQEDYDIDYLQGRVILADPLQSTVSDNQIVRDGGLSGNEAYLVVRYEYTPGLGDVDGYTVGGRATQWVGDHVRIGVTAQNEATASADQELLGTDILLRHSDNTFIKAEYARTDGPGFGQSNSSDGGFLFDEIATPGAAGQIAEAYRFEGSADLQELFNGMEARLTGLIEHADAGFSSNGRIGDGEVDRYSAGLEMALGANTDVSLEFDELQSSRRGGNRSIYGDVNHRLNENWSAGIGVRHDERDSTDATLATTSPNYRLVDGSRTDASAELRYHGNDFNLRGFAQGTIAKDDTRRGNSRAGIGGDWQMTERTNLSGEVSGGDGGVGAQAQLNFQRSEDTEYYLGYALSTGRSDTGYATESAVSNEYGTITAGGRSRLNDSLSVYGEEQMAFGDRGKSLTHSYGVDFTPDEKWTFGATAEIGTIEDDVNGAFERKAVSLSAARASEGLRVATNLEARFEEGEINGRSRDRTTYLMRNTAAYDIGQDWELLGRANFAISESDQASILDSDYVEGVVAAAYRPVENDRFNALLKYTYFEDLSPAQQRSNYGNDNLARQKSQIASIDAQYDLTERLTIGGKYGYRKGEVALDRTNDVFVESDAQLAVVRADYHVVDKWDIMAEGRVKSSDLTQDAQTGALVGVYRHVGNNLKVGVGYSFSEFSDDLTDYSNDSSGAFLNVVGKF